MNDHRRTDFVQSNYLLSTHRSSQLLANKRFCLRKAVFVTIGKTSRHGNPN